MASLEMLRGAILQSLEKNRSLLIGLADYRLPELATALADDVACFIATEAALEAFADVLPSTEGAEPTSGRRPVGRWRHSLERATDGGIGARHVGRPGQTVADADICAACQEAKTPCQRLFFPSALGRPGGGKWLIENVLCLRGAHRRAALRLILKTRGL